FGVSSHFHTSTVCVLSFFSSRYGLHRDLHSFPTRRSSDLQLLGVGLLWVVLTVSFEVGLGRLVLGLPWDRITEDYDLTRGGFLRSEEHTSELQSRGHLVCRLLLEKKKKKHSEKILAS